VEPTKSQNKMVAGLSCSARLGDTRAPHLEQNRLAGSSPVPHVSQWATTPTIGQGLRVIESLDGARLGTTWFAERVQDRNQSAYLYLDVVAAERWHRNGPPGHWRLWRQ
jgi:hypothetical protein